MNKKKKWASILTIATSLILCIVATFSLTLAFFGGNSTASLGTITLKTGVKVGASVTATDNTTKVVPGQQIEINATGTVEPYSSEGTVTSALLRVKFEVGGTMTVTPVFDTTQSITLKTADGDKTGYWVNGGDGYYYLCSTTANATVGNTTLLRFTPVNTTTDSAKTKTVLAGDFQVPTTLTNADSGKDLTVSATFEVIQGEIYVGTSSTPLTDAQLTIANTNVQSVFAEFEPVSYLYFNNERTYSVTVEYEETVPFDAYPFAVIDNGDSYALYYFTDYTFNGFGDWMASLWVESITLGGEIIQIEYSNGRLVYWDETKELTKDQVLKAEMKEEIEYYDAGYLKLLHETANNHIFLKLVVNDSEISNEAALDDLKNGNVLTSMVARDAT